MSRLERPLLAKTIALTDDIALRAELHRAVGPSGIIALHSRPVSSSNLRESWPHGTLRIFIPGVAISPKDRPTE
jgi:hypothetical protein